MISIPLQWKKRTTTFFLIIGILWLPLEFLSYWEIGLPKNVWTLSGILAFSVMISFFVTRQQREIQFTIPQSELCIAIRFGDLFDQNSDIIVPVNDFFDHELGPVINESSVHGQFIKRNPNFDFRTSITSALRKKKEKILGTSHEKKEGRKNRYAIGTTIAVNINSKNCYLVALTETDIETYRVKAHLKDLTNALSEVWKETRINGGANHVALPLIGGGLSDIPLHPLVLLDTIIISIFEASVTIPISGRVEIVLDETYVDKLRLNEIKHRWTGYFKTAYAV